jgi:hypothetical protein
MSKTKPMPESTSSCSIAATPWTPIPPGTNRRMPDNIITSGRSPVNCEYAVPEQKHI